MACERSLVVLLVFLCYSWYPRAEAANGEAGECISGFGPMVAPFGYIPTSQQVIIPSFQFNGSGNILAFHLSGICAGAEGGVLPNRGDNVNCINILQVWRPSGNNDMFHIAADFTATLAVPFAKGVTTSVAVDTPVPFSSGDVLGFTRGPITRLFFQIATPSPQQASHTYYTYDNFATEQQVKTVGVNIPTVMASPIISVEVECCPSATSESPELSSSSKGLSPPVEQTGSPSVSSPLEISSAFVEQTGSPPVSQPSEIPRGQEGGGASAGVAAGVAVGLVLAVVVVVVVVAIVLAVVCSTQQRRKRSARTCHVPAYTLLATDDSASTAMTVIRNQTAVTYDEVKEDTSGGDEAGCVQYDYARPTDVARGVMGLKPSAHDAVLLTPMYEPMSDALCPVYIMIEAETP